MGQLPLLDAVQRQERPRKRVRQTSREVYRRQRAADVAKAEEGRETRKAQVLRILAWYWNARQESPTAYELFEWAKAQGESLFDINNVRPRLRNLFKAGLVTMSPTKRICRVTGEEVHTWRVREAGEAERCGLRRRPVPSGGKRTSSDIQPVIPKLQQQAAAALVAWNVARLEANRLKAERGAIECERERPNYGQPAWDADAAISPCWKRGSYDYDGNWYPDGDVCEPCRRRAELHKQYRIAMRTRGARMRAMQHFAAKAAQS